MVLADHGFTIQEEVWHYGAKLHIPAFTKGKSQLDPVEIKETRKIARVRIHVERVIGLLQQKYTILQSILPIDYLMCNSNKDGVQNIPLIDRILTLFWMGSRHTLYWMGGKKAPRVNSAI